MPDNTEKPQCSSAIACAFPWFAWAAISAGLAIATLRMGEAADKGVADWVSFPAFLLLSIAVLIGYGLINRSQR